MPPDPTRYGPDDLQRDTGVSRETIARLAAFVETLRAWRPRLNLIAASTLDQIWWRHVFDSAQLAPLIPAGTRRLIDIGTGAGFPGLVLAIMGVARQVILVEADGRKCAFLRAAAEAAAATVEIRHVRAESLRIQGDVVIARACAPLTRLLTYAKPLVVPGGICLFPKGAGWEKELTAARREWTMEVEPVPSRTEPAARILVVREISPCHPPSPKPKPPRRP